MMNNAPSRTHFKNFEYRYLEEQKIHVITFLVSSRECTDEFMSFLTQLYDGLTSEDELSMLVDYRQSGMQPVAYVLRKGASWSNSLATHPKVHIAFIHKGEFVVGMFGALLNRLNFGHLRAQFYDGIDGYDKGIVWLENEQF